MSTLIRPRHRRVRATLVGAVVTGVLAAISASALADPGDADQHRVADRSESITVEWMKRRELRDIVTRMPAGWRATEVMRRAAEQPLGDALERARWRATADMMPAGWPATEALRQAAAWPAD